MILAIETSCDESSAAIVDHGAVLSNVIASQIEIHADYGGVVPELATRAHLGNLGPVIGEALREAGCGVEALDGFVATRGPGLPSALMAGLRVAQGMALVRRKPFAGIHHHEAHLYSPWIADGPPPNFQGNAFEPNVSLIVSGGHTLLVHHQGLLRHQVLGGTVDDAAGECFDKSAKLLGLGYPGGPLMERIAEGGDPKRFALPRPMLHDETHDFSFSGLKTAVRYLLRDRPELTAEDRVTQDLRDLCASIQEAIVDVLVVKSLRAARRCRVRCLTASGGVSCNSRLRERLVEGCQQAGIDVRLAPKALTTDNAAMVGVVGELRLQSEPAGDALDSDALPGWRL